MRYLMIIISTSFLFFGSCREENPQPDIKTVNPSQVQLVFPLKNSECNVGRDTAATETTVTFEWRAVDDANEYELFVTNLSTSNEQSFTTVNDTLPVILQRATPYSWFVEAKSSGADSSATSEVWKFYVAGDGTENYVPFPAEIIAPAMSASVNAPGGTITLDWEGSDLDDDITGYDVYFGTSNPPELISSDVTQTQANVNVTSGTIYYWSITTKDAYGNASDSGVAQFKVE